MNGVPVVLTFQSVNKNMLMKVYLSSIVHYNYKIKYKELPFTWAITGTGRS